VQNEPKEGELNQKISRSHKFKAGEAIHEQNRTINQGLEPRKHSIFKVNP